MAMKLNYWLSVAILAMLGSSTAWALVTRTHPFSVEPAGWEAVNNTIEGGEENDFGFSADTKHADGLTTGEIGGTVYRGPSPAWYADNTIGSLDPSTEMLTFSGRLMVDSDNGNPSIGYFNTTDWAPMSGFAPAGICLWFDNYKILATIFIRGYLGDNTDRVICKQVGTLVSGTSISFIVTYDPDGGDGAGTLSFSKNGEEPTVINLSDSEYPLDNKKDLLPNLDHFGIFNAAINATATQAVPIWLDDLSYSAETEIPWPNAAENWTILE